MKEFHQGYPGIGRMKALIRSYTYWPNVDKDIEQVVKTCKGCQLAAKAPPVKFTPWPKSDVPWTRFHINYAGPMYGNYHLIVVDSFSKWPEIFKCKRPTVTVTKCFLTEMVCAFRSTRLFVSDNGAQFTGSEFKTFCKTLGIDQITTSSYHPRSNGQAERFVDTFKRPLKKTNGTGTDDGNILQFLSIYRITPNPNGILGMSPAELMFARKIRSLINWLLPKKKRSDQNRTKQENMKYFRPRDKVFLKSYKNGKEFWQDGVITQRVSKMLYMVKSKKLKHKRYLNQLRRRFTEEISKDNEEPMEVLYDLFDIPTPPLPEMVVQKRTSKKNELGWNV